MGRIAETIEEIYKSEYPLKDKKVRLVACGRRCGINNYNFGLLLDEIKKYKWEK